MNSEYSRWGVVWRLLLFSLLLVAASYAVFIREWGYAALLLVPVLISGGNLLYYMQSIHRKLHFFFEAVKSEDGACTFRKIPPIKACGDCTGT